MQYLGIHFDMKHIPELDPGFIPFGIWANEYEKTATKPVAIAVERDKGQVSVRHTKIHGTPEMFDADYRYLERYMKFYDARDIIDLSVRPDRGVTWPEETAENNP